ncbi:MAG: DUF4177 domain-containing protein [Planctomycetota bacterium]
MLEEVEGTPAAPAAGRWEYMLVADRGRMHHVDLDEINRLGEEGWELVAIIHESRTQTPEVHFYFKRPRV